ncbi:MAG: hypothetical protein WC761_05465 [Candidatus Paceibacterota bacterium]|jgi:hypothetical protein
MEGSLAATAPAAQKLIENINGLIVNPLIAVMFTFALVAFLWGVRGYIAGADNPEKRAQGAQHMLWGIIGMAIMVMAFTIVRIVIQTFGVDAETKEEVEAVIGK